MPWPCRTLGFPPELEVAVKLLLCPGPHPGQISTAICNLCKGPGWAPVALGPSFPTVQEGRRMGFVQQLGWPGMWGTLRMVGCRLLCPPRYQSPLPCQSLPPMQKPHNPHGKKPPFTTLIRPLTNGLFISLCTACFLSCFCAS